MSKITFQKIAIEGFGSIVNELIVDLSTTGLTVVRGHNGAGKSTIFNALYWVLYNKSIKSISKAEIPTWESLRTEEFKGTRVLIDFMVDDDHYSIARHINFNGKTFGVKGANSLIIIKNNEKVTENLYKNDQQAHINMLLGMEPKVFLHTAFFAQKTNRFISASPEEKRLVLDTLFNFERIDKAQQLASFDLAEMDKLLTSNNKKYQELQLSITKLTDDINHAKDKLALHDQFKETQLKSINEQIETVKAQKLQSLETLKTAEANKTLVEVELSNFNLLDVERLLNLDTLNNYYLPQKKGVENSLKQSKEEQWKIEQLYSGTCNRCGQDFGTFKPDDVYKREAELESRDIQDTLNLESIEKGIKETSSKIEVINNQLSQKSGYEVSLKQIINSIETVSKLINFQASQLEKLEADKFQVENQKFEYDFEGQGLKLEALILEISELERVISESEAKYSRIKFFATIGFTAKGLKAYLFENKLRLLNQYVHRYSSLLGFSVQLAVDLESALKSIEIHIAKDGIQCDYGCLSGGEQQRVDLCIAFALHDLISANYDLNLLILDEVFESIDTYQGVEQVSELINFKSFNKSVFVITHNASLEIPNSRILNLN